jgi:hypothetical protein
VKRLPLFENFKADQPLKHSQYAYDNLTSVRPAGDSELATGPLHNYTYDELWYDLESDFKKSYRHAVEINRNRRHSSGAGSFQLMQRIDKILTKYNMFVTAEEFDWLAGKAADFIRSEAMRGDNMRINYGGY